MQVQEKSAKLLWKGLFHIPQSVTATISVDDETATRYPPLPDSYNDDEWIRLMGKQNRSNSYTNKQQVLK